jgi:SAM-dependent methyltransferase
MKNKSLWKPSKYLARAHKASRNPKDVSIGSRFIADIQYKVYEKAIIKHAHGILLDLGCGKVPLYEVYKDYIVDNICVDWINTFHKNSYLDYEFNLNKPLPLRDEQFDTILNTDVLEHISNPDMLWSEMSRILKPKGKIIVGVPFFYWIHEEPYDYYRYTEYKLREFCKNNNLTIISLDPYGGGPEIIFDIIAKQISFSKILSSMHLFLSNIFINSYFGKKISKKTYRHFPLGYCLIAQKVRK